MSIQILQSYASVSETELREFEKAQNLELPKDYREFLLAHNGGKPKPAKFNVLIDNFKNTSRVMRFLGLHNSEYYSLSKYLKIYSKRIPYQLLPIATELSVDLICLSVHGNDYGVVYFWDHDWEVTDQEPNYENVHFMADSFTTFLSSLYDDEELNSGSPV
jgi:hypothetical protein